ncbi:hypothetical protein Q9R46_05330 [Paenibacillus sp. RRE4]|uniref:hypothetical protein n=1 Tax=Paenibacillus sp. RRE4 TaxID=2962587 RepID=UPI0028817F0D|nr:hypothetical protein [Paenibacillus sp. RRE4]MDT0122048.1 hypothetical protein [Paenibacillus sp. RRE4]
MDYYFLESQYPRSGFISGGTTFTPELDKNYIAVDYPLPDHTKAEVELLSSVRSLKVDYFETITGTRVVSDAFKTLLEETGSNVQSIPAVVRYHDDRPVEKTYWIAHLLEQVVASIMNGRNTDAKRSSPLPCTSHHVNLSK